MKRLVFFWGWWLAALFPVMAQNFDWVTHLPGLSEELANDLALGQSGNAYACGAFGNTMIFPNATETAVGSRDAFVVKFDEQGDVRWYTLLNSTLQEQALALGIDSLENVYVLMEVGDTLHVQGNVLTGFNTFYLVVKLDSSGQYLDHFEPIAALNAPDLFIAALDVSPAGRISLGGASASLPPTPRASPLAPRPSPFPSIPTTAFACRRASRRNITPMAPWPGPGAPMAAAILSLTI